jgi:hypothetical protein
VRALGLDRTSQSRSFQRLRASDHHEIDEITHPGRLAAPVAEPFERGAHLVGNVIDDRVQPETRRLQTWNGHDRLRCPPSTEEIRARKRS